MLFRSPYMIGNMVGVVTEDSTHQIIPQPHAQPVRPALTPLNGAVITNCIPNSNNNGYTLIYTLNGNTDSVVYSWTSSGVYTFHFYTASGSSTSTYNGFVPCSLPTSIYEILSDNDIEIYPNPTQTSFTLTLNNSLRTDEIKNILIISDKGENKYTSNVYQEKISTENFAKGIYFIVIKTNDKVITKKLVVR